MKRLLPYPVLSGLLALLWLLLQQGLAPAQLLSALLLGALLPRLLAGFLGQRAQPRRWDLALRLLFVVLKDEDHWLSRGATRNQMLQAAVAFVQKYNPAD